MCDPRLHRRFLDFAGDATFVERFGDPFRPLEPECRVVQFQAKLRPFESLEREPCGWAAGQNFSFQYGYALISEP